MLITPLKTVVIALGKIFLFHGVSFAAFGDDEVRSRYLYCKHYDCTSKANDTRERWRNKIKNVKIAVELQPSFALLVQARNTPQFRSSSISRN